MSRIVCRRVGSERERAVHHAIRHQVFVAEQAIFDGTDQDERDRDESTIHLIGYCDEAPAGSVRLFLIDRERGLWLGDRLAVLEPYRRLGIGAPLVRCATATAAALGGTTMHAHIQPSNVTFFRRLGWADNGPSEIYAGLPHQPMSIALPTAPAGAELVGRLAAGVSARDR